MGYDTWFGLDVFRVDEKHRAKMLEDWSVLDLSMVEDWLQHDLMERRWDARWDEYGQDMEKISKGNPDYVFELTGVGENPGDIWRAWYFNGHVVTWKLEYTVPEWDQFQASQTMVIHELSRRRENEA